MKTYTDEYIAVLQDAAELYQADLPDLYGLRTATLSVRRHPYGPETYESAGLLRPGCPTIMVTIDTRRRLVWSDWGQGHTKY